MSEERVITTVNLSRIDGSYSIWDNPNFITEMRHPSDFMPLHDLRSVLRVFSSWGQHAEARMRVLKVLGDAVCANEDQLRRYLKPFMSASATSAHLNYLRKNGFVHRFKCYIEDFTDENGELLNLRNPAPFAVGLAGYILLTHYYSLSKYFFMHPEAWNGNPLMVANTVQRYVAMNEIRCQLVEDGLLRKWRWYPILANNRNFKKPQALLEIGEDTEDYDSRTWFIFERAQSSQDFIGFLKDRMNLYRNIHEKHGFLPIAHTAADGEKIVVISCATLKVAELIQEEIRLQTLPFPCWLLVDEWYDTGESPVEAAFVTPVKVGTTYELKRIRVSLNGD